MSVFPAHLIAFMIAAALLTVTPGLDTALVLRTAASKGSRSAFLAGIGIALGCLVWGFIVAIGLGALLAASELAYNLLRWVGAAYLVYLGVRLAWSPRREFMMEAQADHATSGARHFRRGFLTNILNPKVGVFYVSFMPQFIPNDANVPGTTILLAVIHATIGILWFAILVTATRPLTRLLRRGRVVAWLDRITAGVFIAFGIRLATSNSH